MKFYGATDQGKVRQKNQDAFLLKEKCNWVFSAVCDGIGGGKAGEVASTMTIDSLNEQIDQVSEFVNLAEAKSWVKAAVLEANRTVLMASIHEDAYAGMGTTLVLVVKGPLGTVCVNVGDSRIYGMNNHLVQLSTDHSYVNDLVRLGKITDEQAKVHPFRNMLTNAIGITNSLSMDLFDVEAYKQILLSSDGLHGYVEESKIEEVLKSDRSIAQKVDLLIQLANDMGGYDNVTLILLEEGGESNV